MDSPLFVSFLWLLAGIIAAVIVHLIFLFLKGRAEMSATKIDDLVVHALKTPLVILAFFIPAFFAFHNALTVYPEYAWIADSNLMFAGYIIIIAWIVSSFIDGLLRTYGEALAEATESELDDRIIEILQKIAKYVIWFVAIIYILNLYQINITPLIAGAGVIGIAIALAAQDLFSNFFGGAIIITDQPFKVGDRVLINDVEGDVVHIGPRSTRVVTPDGDIVTFPNNKITTNIVRNYSLPNPKTRVLVQVTVAGGTDIARVRSALMQVIEDVKKEKPDCVAESPEPTVYLVTMNKTSMTFELTLFTVEYSCNSLVRDALNARIIDVFKNENISFA